VVSLSVVPRSLVDSEGKADRQLSPHHWTELAVETINNKGHLCYEYRSMNCQKIVFIVHCNYCTLYLDKKDFSIILTNLFRNR